MKSSLWVAASLCLFSMGATPSIAFAHVLGSRSIEVEREGHTISTLIHVEAGTVSAALGDEADETTVSAWLCRGLRVASSEGECVPSTDTPFHEIDGGHRLVVALVSWDCPAGDASLTDSTLHPAEPDMKTWVEVEGDPPNALTGARNTITLYTKADETEHTPLRALLRRLTH